ncbi:nuclear transport factor 2 family protein [Sphingomonas sp.]|uniref:nuclear transport factor 2 family protein n=1 Tax=Sphingomonas sp. TaxID=28214 RepID=UPI0038AB6570
MRFTSATTVMLFLASSTAWAKPPSIEAQLIDREKQSWAAWQGQDVAFWKRHLSTDHVEIDGPNGPQDRDYVINGVANRKCSVASYNLGSFTFRQLGPDAGMLVYRATQEFACGDKHIPNSGWVTSLYQRRGGRWLNVLFEHLLIPPPKPAEPAKG